MFSLHFVVFGHFLEFSGLLILLLLHDSVLFVDCDQLLFLLVISGIDGQLGCGQSSSVVDGGFSLDEEVEVLVIKMEHFLALPGEAQSGEQILDAPQAHDFIFDGIVGGLDAPVLLLERFLDDAG